MKPPPRTRTKTNRNLKPEPALQSTGKVGRKWQQPEQKKLLNALKKLSNSGGTHREIDYVYLKTCVPTRSPAEISAMVESLKNKVILCAGRMKRLEERGVRKPIEDWTHVASAVAGILEENISSAFSQMLIVSSTEPCSLKSFDPLHVYRPHTEACPVVPIRPPPFLPVQGQHPDINTAHSLLMFKSPAPAISPARTFPAPCQVVTVANSKICQLQQRLPPTSRNLPSTSSSSSSPVIFCRSATSPQSPSASVSPAAAASSSSAEAGSTESIGGSVKEANISTISSPSPSVCPSLQMPLTPSGTSHNNIKLPAVGQPCPAISNPIATSFSTPTAAVNRSSEMHKCTKDNSRRTGVKFDVDFERIYHILSGIQNPSEACHLSPMESAILLDLLMSLPEELPQLNCNKLHKHMVQVYQCLSAPANSNTAKEFFAERRAASAQNLSGASGHHNTTSDVMDSVGGKVQQPEPKSQTTGTPNIHLCPPLNPFMVPLKLLMRRQADI